MNVNTTILLRSIIWLTVAGAALVLAQLWLELFTSTVFWKLLVTFAILGLLASFILAIRQDMSEEKKLKDDKFVN